jgi:sulfatase modifying factor 1
MCRRQASSLIRVSGPVAGAVLIASLIGCATGPKFTSDLADKYGEVTHANLPPGFFPMVGLDPGDPNDFVDGWPRYIVCNADNSVMVYVQGGDFLMGSDNPAEGPAGHARVQHFYIDVHEVNNVQFDRFRKAAIERGPLQRVCDPLALFTQNELDKMRQYDRPWIESNAGHIYEYELYYRGGKKQKMYPETAMNFWFWKGQTPEDIDYYLDYWEPGHNNNDPVRNVSWWEAWYYSRWAGKALPTEAQWEMAARGTNDERSYPWGDEEEYGFLRCNYRNSGEDFDGHQFVAPVAAYPGGASPYGVYNMAGNVWEWCADWHDAAAGMRRRDYPWRDPSSVRPQHEPGGAMTTVDGMGAPTGDRNTIELNPVGPLYGSQRALRGGAYTSSLEGCRVTSRIGAQPDVHMMNAGFRCVLALP